jgi:hypothetical protein
MQQNAYNRSGADAFAARVAAFAVPRPGNGMLSAADLPTPPSFIV